MAGPVKRRNGSRAGYNPNRRQINRLVTAALATLCAWPAAGSRGESADVTPPLRIVAVGDSLIAGFGLSEADSFPARLESALRRRGRSVAVTNAGVSGDTTADGLARLEWAIADRPDLVIVCLGANDALRGLDPRYAEANLQAILDRLTARKIPVVLAGMLAPPNLGRDYGRRFNGLFPALAERNPGVYFYPFFLEGVVTEPRFNQLDGIHPNRAGVTRIVDGILPVVESALIAKSPGPG